MNNRDQGKVPLWTTCTRHTNNLVQHQQVHSLILHINFTTLIHFHSGERSSCQLLLYFSTLYFSFLHQVLRIIIMQLRSGRIAAPRVTVIPVQSDSVTDVYSPRSPDYSPSTPPVVDRIINEPPAAPTKAKPHSILTGLESPAIIRSLFEASKQPAPSVVVTSPVNKDAQQLLKRRPKLVSTLIDTGIVYEANTGRILNEKDKYGWKPMGGWKPVSPAEESSQQSQHSELSSSSSNANPRHTAEPDNPEEKDLRQQPNCPLGRAGIEHEHGVHIQCQEYEIDRAAALKAASINLPPVCKTLGCFQPSMGKGSSRYCETCRKKCVACPPEKQLWTVKNTDYCRSCLADLTEILLSGGDNGDNNDDSDEVVETKPPAKKKRKQHIEWCEGDENCDCPGFDRSTLPRFKKAADSSTVGDVRKEIGLIKKPMMKPAPQVWSARREKFIPLQQYQAEQALLTSTTLVPTLSSPEGHRLLSFKAPPQTVFCNCPLYRISSGQCPHRNAKALELMGRDDRNQ